MMLKTRAQCRVDELEALFCSAPMSQSYGEDLSVRDHMLQAAELATEQALAPPLIAACLLHDLGWGLANTQTPHEASGATFLAQYFADDVSQPVKLHVAAKRYLVAREMGYIDRLSAESVRTLQLQGGAMSHEEALDFEQSAHFHEAIDLRRIDETAKYVGQAVRPFAAYRPLLLSLINR